MLLLVCAVNSLRAIKKSLNDPFKNLRQWDRGDPCLSNWTGIICHNVTFADGHFHVSEVYDLVPLEFS